MSEDAKKQRLSNFQLAAYGVPAIPLAMMNLPLLAILPAYYAKVVGIGLAQVGLIFVIARIWDGVTDPLVGILSDHTRTRWGRRRIWMAAAAPLLLASVWWICRPPPEAGVLYLGIGLLVTYFAWTLVQIPYLSWGAELSESYIERSRISGFREAGTMLGIICVLCLPVFMLDPDNPPLQDVLTIFLITFSILLPITIFTAVRSVKERSDGRFELVGFWKSIRIFRINRPFLRFIIALLFFRTGWSVFDANYILFYEQYLDVTGGFMLYILIGYVSSVCFAPVVIKAASRFSKHRILAVSLVANIGFMLALMYFVDVSSRFQVSAVFVFMGIGIAGTNMMPTAIIADTVDFGQLKGGGEQSGLYMAAYNLALKVCMALGVGIAFPLLQLYGFDATIQNDVSEVNALKYISCLVPIMFFIPGIALLWNFPLNARRLSLIQRYVRRRKPGLQFEAV